MKIARSVSLATACAALARACGGKSHSPDAAAATRLSAVTSPAPPMPAPPAAQPSPPPPADDAAPSPEERAEFQRRVPK